MGAAMREGVGAQRRISRVPGPWVPVLVKVPGSGPGTGTGSQSS